MLLHSGRLVCILVFTLAPSAFAQSDFEDTNGRAESGDASAQIALAFMYADGEGVKQDDHEALNWFKRAAEQGSLSAQQIVGIWYLAGRGAPQNYQEAFKWLKLAARHGNSGAQSEIAQMYEIGRGVPQSFFLAYVWYSLANTTMPRGSGPIISGAAFARDRVARELSPQALEQAQAQATRCFESNFKDCGE